ncbi:hypothetical protein GLOIN_2v1790547 [Rhizophagus irregularis DAOM 181602=DAOM 197198]|uniref:Uncharacterized protein n=1 Tax=Rhizophagus irregularis (strain DAOM 181602 / DAOM 197198 / MUCL 43194) TaxID=747089 RepID=A0A2P4NYV8_RHIID|nr:hypothetical protein GLOIN_2v1790547 [Rhizophagus irregularis DAOM 181602=DAOM 197198]POG58314.1 hypothetical protein GLOIN_2v1790547 [Rhizophagus irregularis DAOM 181602=DAOM 197198]|eukprot:XP_025165180.1 hypothetical protein GLOIN_2v1790547 [Rhizophagus irregularis DAOM 181602=DAOM 197198]
MDHIVVATYVEECNQAVFSDIKAGTWDWIDCHSQICKYSVDFRKCEDRNYKYNKLPSFDEHCPSISPEIKSTNHTEKVQNNNERQIRDSSKREKGGMKNPQLWKQDHLTFQVNLRETRKSEQNSKAVDARFHPEQPHVGDTVAFMIEEYKKSIAPMEHLLGLAVDVTPEDDFASNDINTKSSEKENTNDEFDFTTSSTTETNHMTIIFMTGNLLPITENTDEKNSVVMLFVVKRIDKIKYITTYTANSIVELSNNQIQTIINYFTEKTNIEFSDDSEDHNEDNSSNLDTNQINVSEVQTNILVPAVEYNKPSDDKYDENAFTESIRKSYFAECKDETEKMHEKERTNKMLESFSNSDSDSDYDKQI